MMKSRFVFMTVFASCVLALAAGAQDFPMVLLPFREATVASSLDSELREYHYRIGETFTNGAVIAELDDARFRVAFARAQEHRDFTARVAEEQRELRKKDFASELDLRKAEYDAKLAESDFADANLSLSRCRFVAPFNGKIAELLTQRYETVKPGQALFRIIEDDILLAVANLPIGSVEVGAKMEVVPDGLLPVTGTVYEVAPQADNRTGTVRIRVRVENADGRLAAGMTGTLSPYVAPPPEQEADAPCKFKDGELVIDPAGPRYASVADAVTGFAVGKSAPRLPIEIAGLRFTDGAIAYVVERTPQTVSIQSLKRFGELTAAVYDADGKRLAYLQPRQIALPGTVSVVTNFVPFSAAACIETKDCKLPVKLVFRVERDIRALELASGNREDGKR